MLEVITMHYFKIWFVTIAIAVCITSIEGQQSKKVCKKRSGCMNGGTCLCTSGWTGTACEVSLNPVAKSCMDILKNDAGVKGKDGVYQIKDGTRNRTVFCDMTTDGGGWTVFQKRVDGSTDFYKNWKRYKKGFGKPSKNYWIGNAVLYKLTKGKDQELRVDLLDFNNNTAYAQYSTFYIGDEASNYTLTVSGYSGTARYGMAYHNGMMFSTSDRDNDKSAGNCAISYRGAWWYNACHTVNLNGEYAESGMVSPRFPTWYYWKNKSEALKETKMMIRPKN